MRSDLTAWMEDPNFLRDYLLGRLKDEKRDAVERRLLADDDYFELVEAMEGDLLADCASGALSPQDHARVMRTLASSPRGMARLTASRELAILSRERPIVHTRQSRQPIPFPAYLLPTPRLAGGIAAIAAMLVAVFGGVRLSQRTDIPGGGAAMAGNRTAGALHRLQVPDQVAQTPALPPLQAPPSPQIPQIAQTPKTPQTPAADTPREPHRPPVAVRELAPAVLELALTTLRSGEGVRPTLIVPAGTRRIEIKLPIQEGDDFPSYRASILDAADEPVWQQQDLVSHPAADEGAVVLVSLPADQLPAGTYRLELNGVRPDGTFEKLGKPLFDIRTP
jgi:hypothetical protein